MEPRELEGKVSLVTGASRGLGKAIAIKLASLGSKVAINYLASDEMAYKVAEEVEGMGRGAMLVKADVADAKAVRAMTREIVKRWEKIDVLVNNAGVMIRKNIEDISLDEWQWIMRVNVDGVFLGTKYAMGAMKKSGGGSIINISSMAGIVGTPGTSVYNASKAAVRLFTKVAALECSKDGLDYNIRVNSIHPGLVLTDMVDAEIKEEASATGQILETIVGSLRVTACRSASVSETLSMVF